MNNEHLPQHPPCNHLQVPRTPCCPHSPAMAPGAKGCLMANHPAPASGCALRQDGDSFPFANSSIPTANGTVSPLGCHFLRGIPRDSGPGEHGGPGNMETLCCLSNRGHLLISVHLDIFLIKGKKTPAVASFPHYCSLRQGDETLAEVNLCSKPSATYLRLKQSSVGWNVSQTKRLKCFISTLCKVLCFKETPFLHFAFSQ